MIVYICILNSVDGYTVSLLYWTLSNALLYIYRSNEGRCIIQVFSHLQMTLSAQRNIQIITATKQCED